MDGPERVRQNNFVLALALALPAFAFLAARTWFTCDDAYISFRYARHLAEGAGLVFNRGESPPVEGYSNFLWVVWLALSERAGLDTAIVANVTSILCGAGLVALVAWFAQRRLELDRLGTCATALFAALLPPLTLWSTGGLETMAFALATFACFAALALDPARPRPVLAGVCALAAALLRADGALWAGLVILAAAITAGSALRRTWRPWLVVLTILVTGTLVHTLWRHAYYGEWLPNTAHVKAGFSVLRLDRGLLYAGSVALALPVVPLVMLATLAVRARPNPRMAAAALVVLCGAAAYAIDIGGDFMPMGRFVIVAMPFVVLLFALVWKQLAGGRAIAFALPVLALTSLPSFDVDVVPLALRERFHFRWNEAQCISEAEMARGMKERAELWALTGRALAMHTQPGESIVIPNVGAFGYFTELYVYDVVGLVSPEVARRDTPPARASPGHDRLVGPEFFFDKKPTYISPWLANAGTELQSPIQWASMLMHGTLHIERIPLHVEDGFPPGLELELPRFYWGP